MKHPTDRSPDGPSLSAVRGAFATANGRGRFSDAAPCPACGRPVLDERALRIHGQTFHRSCTVPESSREDDAA